MRDWWKVLPARSHKLGLRMCSSREIWCVRQDHLSLKLDQAGDGKSLDGRIMQRDRNTGIRSRLINIMQCMNKPNKNTQKEKSTCIYTCVI